MGKIGNYETIAGMKWYEPEADGSKNGKIRLDVNKWKRDYRSSKKLPTLR